MEIIATALTEIRIVLPQRIGDHRGFFSEVWNARELSRYEIGAVFVQDNHTGSLYGGTLRGLHYQIPPIAQGKLVRVTRGAIFDVAVDIRRGSPTFGRYVGTTLSADNWRQVWIPPGFAHGYCTLEDETEVLYKVTDYYSPAHERGIAWDDPELAIAWPVGSDAVIVSERDRRLPRLTEQPDLFGVEK